MDVLHTTLSTINDYADSLPLCVTSRKLCNLNGFVLSQGLFQAGYVPVWSRSNRLRVFGAASTFPVAISHVGDSSQAAEAFLYDKAHMREVLRQHDVVIAPGAAFAVTDYEQALNFFQQQNLPCVVKPAIGNKGIGVSVGVETDVEFKDAWQHACDSRRRGDEILVEHQFRGAREARLLVVDGVCVGAFTRIPPFIVGNGEQSVIELIEEKNLLKCFNPNECNLLITLDSHRHKLLAKQGYEADSIVPKGVQVRIDYKGSVSAGADTLEFFTELDPGYKAIAERVAACAAPTVVVGVDIMARDFNAVPNDTDYVVLEANKAPALGGHLYPSYGTPSDVVTPIIDYCTRQFPPRKDLSQSLSCRVRVVAFTDQACVAAAQSLLSWLHEHAPAWGGSVQQTQSQVIATLPVARWQDLIQRFYQHYSDRDYALLLNTTD
ncbi:hypothetical protein ACR0ST_00835 [Aliidiomarina sp. Khilg15.8]